MSLNELHDRVRPGGRQRINNSAWIQIRGRTPKILWRTSKFDRIDNTFYVIGVLYANDGCDGMERMLPDDADYFLFSDDVPPENITAMLAYCGTENSKHHVISLLTRDRGEYNIDAWPAEWMAKYEIPFEERSDTLFWIGGWSAPRAGAVEWIRKNVKGTELHFSAKEKPFLPMTQQNKYKYIMDVEGLGWSCRLVWLFHMGAVIFVLDRPLHDFFFLDHFKPWVHYVPVKRDGTDMQQVLDRVRAMPDKGKSIADAGRAKAREIINDTFFMNHMKNELIEYTKKYGILNT